MKIIDRKSVKCLVIREIITNFAPLNSALMRRSIANHLTDNAMGGFMSVWRKLRFDVKNEK